MNNAWYQDVESSVYSRAKAILTSKLKTKYSDLYITDDDNNIKNPKFPTIYFNYLQPSERGMDLEGITINAILLTVQIEIYTKDKISANEVSKYLVETMKSMGFRASMPSFNNISEDYKRTVSRYSRVVGYGDSF